MAEITLENVPQRVRDLFNKGFGTFERGNLDYAIDMLFTCVEMEPAFLQARKFLRAAEVQRFKGNENAMQRIAGLGAAVQPCIRAHLHLRAGRSQQALLSVERAMRHAPLNKHLIHLLGAIASRAGLPEVGVQTLEMARDHFPKDLVLLEQLGRLYLEVGQTKNAREVFEKLCEERPNDPAAIKALKDAMALESMSSDGWSDTAQKGGSFREMIRDSKEAELLEQESKAVKTDKDADALIVDAKAKIETEPGNVNYYRALARLYAQKQAFSEALETLEKARSLSSGDPELDAVLSATRLQQFDHEIAELEKAGETEAADAKKSEREQFAFDDLNERVRRYPNDQRLRFDLGIKLFERDQIKDAIQQLQLAQKSPNHRIRALYYLGLCFKRKKQYDLAQEQLELARSQLPKMDSIKKDICYELGVIAEETGNVSRAAEFYKQIYQVDIGYKDISEKIEHLYRK